MYSCPRVTVTNYPNTVAGNTDLLSYSSGVQKSKIHFTELEARSWLGWLLVEALRGDSVFLPSSASMTASFSWLMASSSISKAHYSHLCFCQHITFFSDSEPSVPPWDNQVIQNNLPTSGSLIWAHLKCPFLLYKVTYSQGVGVRMWTCFVVV